jgi:condensin complex subunit 3
VNLSTLSFSVTQSFITSTISEDMYNTLRVALFERVRDKEPFVRVQAVAALAKICGSEDIEELGEDEQMATEVLENLLAHDPSACVSPPLSPPCS